MARSAAVRACSRFADQRSTLGLAALLWSYAVEGEEGKYGGNYVSQQL